MQVTCPNCGARYAVDPLAIGPSGRTVQCMRCNHRWRERPIATAAIPPPPRPVPDFVIRPPTYQSGLPALARSPSKTPWGWWLAGAAGLAAASVLIAYFLRHEILSALPAEWHANLPIDALQMIIFRQ
jgi:predicted Zn finger-like uncharacterized protein